MKTFWNDYKELCKQTGTFYKKHWKGIIVMNVGVVGVEYAIYKILEHKNEKEMEEFRAKYCDYD